MIFQAQSYLGWDVYLYAMPYKFQARKIAKKLGRPDVTVQLPCGLWFKVVKGKVKSTEPPVIP